MITPILKGKTQNQMKASKKKIDKEKLLEWRNKGLEKANYQCEYCGKKEYLNAHHFYSRQDYKLRYDEDNCFILCSGCHTLSSIFSAHKTPADFVEWAIKKRGNKWYKRVREKHWNYD